MPTVTSETLQQFIETGTTPTEAVVKTEPAEVVKTEETNVVPPEELEAQRAAKKQDKLNKRFSELTSQRDNATEELRRERERADKLASELAAKSPTADKDGPPDPAKFTDQAEFNAAVVDYQVQQALAKRDAEQAVQAETKRRQNVVKAFNERAEAARQTIADYDDTVQSAEIETPQRVLDAILESEVGPLILYHLAENPAEVSRINELSPAAQLKAIGKLEARFETVSTPAKEKLVKLSSAPEPITPLKGGTKAGTLGDLVNEKGEFTGNYQDFKKWSASQRKG